VKIAISNLSIPYHTINFHRNLKEAGYDATLLQGDISKVDWRQYDVLWNIGSFLSMNVDIFYEIVKKKNPNIKIISHWVGTDLLQLRQFVTYRKKCLRCVLQDIDKSVTDNRNFQKEFYELTGLDAEYVTLIPEKPLELKPLPEKFAVACYAYHPRLEFYRFATIIDTATKMPDVEFYFFRLEGESPIKNVHYLGWVEGEKKMDMLEKCSVALSIPMHGSLSVLVIEMLQMGRRAIASEPHPHCLQAQKPDDIVRFLTELKDKASPDEEASKFYREEYSLKHQLELVENALKKLE
jgi:hypothetical protein